MQQQQSSREGADQLEIGNDNNSSNNNFKNKKEIETSFNILTYNMWLINMLIGQEPLYKLDRINGFLNHLKNNSFDFIFLQEVHRFGNLNGIINLFNNFNYNQFINGIKNEIKNYEIIESDKPFLMCQDSGLLILSKYPVLKRENYVFKSTTWRSYVTAKGILYALVDCGSFYYNENNCCDNVMNDGDKDNNKRNDKRRIVNNKMDNNNNLIHLFTLHMEAFDNDVRSKQINELVQFIKKCIQPYLNNNNKQIDNNFPSIIIAGDFNIDSIKSKQYLELINLLNENICEFKDVFGTNCKQHPITFGGEATCLDHILVNNNFELTKRNNMKDDYFYEEMIVNWKCTVDDKFEFPISDHFGVKTKLKLK
ncbi:hypothetical protein ABK040_002743 [Willaertia magna]